MTWARSIAWCACASPLLLIACVAWLYVHVGVAVIFMAASMFGAGYAARWLDEGFREEEKARNIWRKYGGP